MKKCQFCSRLEADITAHLQKYPLSEKRSHWRKTGETLDEPGDRDTCPICYNMGGGYDIESNIAP